MAYEKQFWEQPSNRDEAEEERLERKIAKLTRCNADLMEACEAALMVGEIQFETCVLSKSVKERLLTAIARAKGL